MTDEMLHKWARVVADGLIDPDKKQLRFNDIVRVARAFYTRPAAGVFDLVLSCDRAATQDYVKGKPAWETLEREYGWMIHAA